MSRSVPKACARSYHNPRKRGCLVETLESKERLNEVVEELLISHFSEKNCLV